jgi:hypothetical protein
MRSSRLPDVAGDPEPGFTRCTALNAFDSPFELELSEIGNPLSNAMIEVMVQSPRMAAPSPELAQRLPCPNGSSNIGDSTSLCGTSSRPMLYSASRS